MHHLTMATGNMYRKFCDVSIYVSTCLCGPVSKTLGCHLQYSVTCAAPVIRRFNPSFGPVRRVHLLKSYFIIIPMHVMIRKVIPGR